MKLLTKTSLIIITLSVFIMFAGNYLFFHISKQVINNHIDTELSDQMHKIQHIFETDGIPKHHVFLNYEVEIKTIKFHKVIEPYYIDTVLRKEEKEAYVPYRALRFSHKLSNHNQQVTIYKSLVSSDKLVQQITFASVIVVLLFVLLIYIMNRYIFEKVWSIFFRNLSKVENYDFKSQKDLELEAAEIEEFDKLNTVHQKMVKRIKNDFINLKELTANTSHELQTPLAIIKAKSELLLQSENLTEKELNTINTILETIQRLSKLNQSLLLVSKIENNQYDVISKVKIHEIITNLIENYGILIDARQFDLKVDASNTCVDMNSVLADVLISNLIKNAIVHGAEKGKIQIILEKNNLIVCNSGEPLNIPKEQIFKRFVKSSTNKNSSGMGLEIVHKICTHYGIKIDYEYQNNLHCFTLDFSEIASKH